jgi:hypothetical protein
MLTRATKLYLQTHDHEGRLLRWRDSAGLVHAVEHAVADAPGGIDVWWTRCGRWNVARGEAWGGEDELSCPACRVIEQGI